MRERALLAGFVVVGAPYFLVKWTLEGVLELWDRRTRVVTRWPVHPMDMRTKP